jgi:hypothetical protein
VLQDLLRLLVDYILAAIASPEKEQASKTAEW